MSDEPMGRYRLRAWMIPMKGQPVNWNARAIIWSGADRRYWLRHVVWRCYSMLREHCTSPRVRRLALWLFGLVDDRDRTYAAGTARLRRWLNTAADVEARRAWAETNRYWKARERDRARKVKADD